MGSQSALAGQLGPDLLRAAVYVMLKKLLHLGAVFGQEKGLAVGVEPWPPGPPGHLAVLDDRNGRHSPAVLISFVAPDQYPARRQVQACRQGGGTGYYLDAAFPKALLHQSPLLRQEAGMVEGNAMRDARRQADRRLALPAGQDAGGDLSGGVIGGQKSGEPRCCRFGIFSGVFEDEDLG